VNRRSRREMVKLDKIAKMRQMRSIERVSRITRDCSGTNVILQMKGSADLLEIAVVQM